MSWPGGERESANNPPHTMRSNVRFGSKRRHAHPELRLPVYPSNQTSNGGIVMSEKCQQRKWQLHSITASARPSNVGGMVKPIDFAVLRLITSSNVVGC